MNRAVVLLLLIIFAFSSVMPVFGVDSRGPPEHLRERTRPVLEIDGVVYVDAADDGVLEVGVVNIGLARSVEARLRELGIPLSLVRIVETKPIFELETLRDRVRPLVGGLQIAFTKGGLVYLCTLGFNAGIDIDRNGVVDYYGFLTNSHCTSKEFGFDGTTHYQPLPSNENAVGVEAVDPPAFDCGIKGLKCRYSDAAFSKILPGVQFSLGYIARTGGVNDGSINIVGAFKIIGENKGNAVVGTFLRKVGRTTGQTEGTVTNSCADVRPIGSRVVRLCQDIVSASQQIVGGGDSGSPVFKITDDQNTPDIEVTLYGVLWGGSSDGTTFVYSPITNVEKDLGQLKTVAS